MEPNDVETLFVAGASGGTGREGLRLAGSRVPTVRALTRDDGKRPQLLRAGADEVVVDDLRTHEGWRDVTAVKTGRVYAVDGNALFNRPSHRLVESLQVLQWCLHPAFAEQLGDETHEYVTRFGTEHRTSV